MPRALVAVLLTTLVVGIPTSAFAQGWRQACPPARQRSCPPTEHCPVEPEADRNQPAPAPSLDDSQQAPQQPGAPSNDFQQVNPPQQAQPTFSPSQPTTAATSAQSLAPNSIGDFFGTGQSAFTILGSPYVGPNAAASGGNVGRQKFAENVSPIPRDRVFVNYSFFNNVPLTANGTDVNRFTPGFEKTFNDGNMSIEFRAPFAATADSTFFSDGSVQQNEFEWGDLTVFLKALLYANDEIAVSGGVGFSFPTRDPFVVRDVGTGVPTIKVDNNSVHALPFLAALWTPNDQLFVQAFAQFDTDLNGNTVYVNNGGGAVDAGRIQDQTYGFFSLITGYWIYQNPCGKVQGIAPVVEFHFNRSLSNADAVSFGGTGVSGGDDTLSVTNTVVGVNMYFHDNLQMQAGYGFPLAGADDQFDGELRISLNWLFGKRGSSYGNSCIY